VHFDPAADDRDYLHRSGRTGRAGASGTVVTLIGTKTSAKQKPKPQTSFRKRPPQARYKSDSKPTYRGRSRGARAGGR
jgi:superfamily II DNA/RNA helicase